MGRKCHAAAALAIAFAAAAAAAVAADRGLSLVGAAVAPVEEEMSLFRKVANLMWRSDGNSYQHVWPVITKPLRFFFPAFLCFLFTEKEHFVCFYQSSVASLTVLRWLVYKVRIWICLVGSECQSSSALDLSWNPVWVMQTELTELYSIEFEMAYSTVVIRSDLYLSTVILYCF